MSEASSIEAINGWKRDAIPNSKVYFLLNGKPYKGAFNRRYVGKVVTYYTGRARSRYSLQLERIAKGFTIEDEPVVSMMERWLYKEPLKPVRFQDPQPIINEVSIYGNIVGHNGIENEAVCPAILGYNLVRKDPLNGQLNILDTNYDYRMNELQKQRRDILKQKFKDGGAVLTNRALQPGPDRAAVRQSLLSRISNISRKEIQSAAV